MSAEAQIRQYAERIVRLEMERRERAEDIKEIKAEAKSSGFNVKLIATCVRLMLLEQDKQNAAIREHSELDLYLNAVGLLDGVESEEVEETRQDAGGRGREIAKAAVNAAPDPAEASVVGESPAPASAQVSRESASEVRGPGSAELVHAGPGIVPPLPGANGDEKPASREGHAEHDGFRPASAVVATESGLTSPGGEQPGTLSSTDPHHPAPHTNTRAAA